MAGAKAPKGQLKAGWGRHRCLAQGRHPGLPLPARLSDGCMPGTRPGCV